MTGPARLGLGRPLLTPRAALALGISTALLATLLFVERPLTAPVSDKLEIADLTWVEVREAVRHGFTTAIVPSGGLEQNGPHMIIGKHDRIVASAARGIARKLGRALVTPVVSFVPEGEHWPPTGHMRFPGTIGVTEQVFAGTLEGIARSLKASGFRTICFIADHGASLKPQAEVAERLSREWAGEGVRVLGVDAYYADEPQVAWLMERGESRDAIGRHAGIQDTSELLATYPEGVKIDRAGAPLLTEETGASGDALRASAERGRALLAIKIDAAVSQIRAASAGQ